MLTLPRLAPPQVYKTLYEEYDHDEAWEAVCDDWNGDTGGARALPRERFMDSWFELADIWTVTTEVRWSANLVTPTPQPTPQPHHCLFSPSGHLPAPACSLCARFPTRRLLVGRRRTTPAS